MGYLIGTVVIFAYGPFRYSLSNPAKLYAFVALAYAAIAAGYLVGLMSLGPRSYDQANRRVLSPRNLLLFSGIWTLLFAYPMYSAATGGGTSVLTSIVDPGEAYASKLMVASQGNVTSSLVQVRTLTAVAGIFFLPLGVCFWPNLRRMDRWLVFAATTALIGTAVSVGTLKGLGDLGLSGLAAILVRCVARRTRVLSWRLLIPTCVVFLGFLCYMAWAQTARIEYYGANVNTFVPTIAKESRGIPVVREISPEINTAISMILFYPSHGYAGLDGCLSMPFEWTYGAGNSPAICSWIEQYLGVTGIQEKNYVFRWEAHCGLIPLMFWSTAFPWFASDVTFAGAILLMFVLGFIISRVWSRAVICGDPVAIATLGQLAILIAYLPCNNQLLQSRASFCATLGLCVIWSMRWIFEPSHKLHSKARFWHVRRVLAKGQKQRDASCFQHDGRS